MALAVVCPSIAGAQAADPARSAVARTLVRAARDAIAMGYLDAADDFLSEALDIAPADPDANYLGALVALKSGGLPFQAITLLENALISSEFAIYTREDAAILYAALLVRTGNPADALRFLSGLPRDAEILYLESLAFWQAGDQSAARRSIAQSLECFPRDGRAIMAWLEAADRPTVSREDRILVDAAFKALPGLKETDMRILIDLAPYADSADAARLMVREYRVMDGRDARAIPLALSYGLMGDEDAVRETLSGRYSLDTATLSALCAALSAQSARAYFIEAFAGYSGAVSGDSNRDGIADSLAAYERGTLSSWSLDANQDGRPELEARFSESAPTDILIHSGSASTYLRYGAWPYLASATLVEGQTAKAYSFAGASVPMQLVRLSRLKPLEGGPWFASRTDLPLPTETWLANKAIRVETRSVGASASYELFQGEPLRSWWNSADGALGLAWYRAGIPAYDRADMDGDGRFETRRFWALQPDGVPFMERLESDLDGDGVFEYRKRLVPPLAETWDVDADGLPDLGYEALGDGTRIYSCSIRRDGRLDTRVITLGDRVLRVERDGVALALLPDAGGSVIWLGRKPFDFGSTTPLEGMGSRNGVRFSVLKLGGRLYAEALDQP